MLILILTTLLMFTGCDGDKPEHPVDRKPQPQLTSEKWEWVRECLLYQQDYMSTASDLDGCIRHVHVLFAVRPLSDRRTP